jgi:hypothetical protein
MDQARPLGKHTSESLRTDDLEPETVQDDVLISDKWVQHIETGSEQPSMNVEDVEPNSPTWETCGKTDSMQSTKDEDNSSQPCS